MRNLFFALLIALSACNQHHHNHHDHDHHHDEVHLIITAYNESFEVFAESDPLVMGQNAEILVHVTHLNNFKPVRDAVVAVSLIQENTVIRQERDKPYKPGIYRFRLKPEFLGEARFVFEITTQGETQHLDGGSFRIFDDEHRAIHYAEDLLIDHPAAVSFTKEQSWLVDFATAPVSPQPIGRVIKTVGEVLPSRGEETVLIAQTSGVLSFISKDTYEGVEVLPGGLLFRIATDGLADGNTSVRYREAFNNYEKARADYERVRQLAEASIASGRELSEAKNIYENARAVYENLSQNFPQGGQTVKSPTRAFVNRIFVEQGQFVEAGQPLVSLATNSGIIIRAEVQQRYAHLLPLLVSANISCRDKSIFPLDQLGGRILSYGRSISEGSHLLPVFMQLENHPNWPLGMLLDVYLKTAEDRQPLAVPNTALIEEQGNYFVFVQIHPESFEKREIKPGLTDGIFTEVLRGLHENERIVSKGAILVKIAAASSAIDPHSGHVH